jgi:HSP20 family protein
MANQPIKKSEQQGRSESTSLQRPSLYSLTPRDFFTASPFELMRRFTDDLDRLFEGIAPTWKGSRSIWSPPIEVSEKDGQLSICAELPGVKKDDVKVELTDGALTISGERKQEQDEQQGDFYRSERIYGAFTRTIPIPEGADVENAKATFEDGVLEVSVPVPESKRRRREVPIETKEKQSQPQSKAA